MVSKSILWLIWIVCLVFSISVEHVSSQICDGMTQFERCSTNPACKCFQIVGTDSVGICADELLTDCSALDKCNDSLNSWCAQDHRCVYHPQCGDYPVCYPIPKFNQQLCPLLLGNNVHRVLRMITQIRLASWCLFLKDLSHLYIDDDPKICIYFLVSPNRS